MRIFHLPQSSRLLLKRIIATLSSLTVLLLLAGQSAVAGTGAVRSTQIQQLQAVPSAPAHIGEMNALILDGNRGRGLGAAIAARGVAIERRRGELYQVRIQNSKIKPFLDKLPAGTVARLPYPRSTTVVSSQGVDLTGASDMHSLLYDGTGVKIGVIDLGFSSLSTSQAAGELPPYHYRHDVSALRWGRPCRAGQTGGRGPAAVPA